MALKTLLPSTSLAKSTNFPNLTLRRHNMFWRWQSFLNQGMRGHTSRVNYLSLRQILVDLRKTEEKNTFYLIFCVFFDNFTHFSAHTFVIRFCPPKQYAFRKSGRWALQRF